MGKERKEKDQDNRVSSNSSDEVLEGYLSTFARFGKQSAILVNPNGNEPIFTTLDGTTIYSLNKLAKKTRLTEGQLEELLEAGEIKGYQIGTMWFASPQDIRDYNKQDTTQSG